MINTNNEIVFIYRHEYWDDELEYGLEGASQHTVGKPLASIEDVVKDDGKFNGEDAWGLSHDMPRTIIVKEGMFEYDDGLYLNIFGGK